MMRLALPRLKPLRIAPPKRASAWLAADPMRAFAVATLTPVPLLALGAVFGGAPLWLALVYLTLFVALVDQMVPMVAPAAPEGAEFPAADRLSAGLALAHLVMLPLAAWAIGGDSGLGAFERLGAFLAFGLFFGQVSNPNAHELIHRGNRWLFRLGMWVYISLCYGHHTSAHRLVHHRHVGTPDDPNTAEYDENFYDFALRAWPGEFLAGLDMENARRQQADATGIVHPYVIYVGGSVLVGLAILIGLGFGPLLAWLMLSAYATVQLLLSDYVQHYGLARRRLSASMLDATYEPVGPQHSWNAPHWFSSALMLHAPRHSDHHAHPARPYPALRLPEAQEAPMLPYALPVMATIALAPSLWRRVMHPRLAPWRDGGAAPPITRV